MNKRIKLLALLMSLVMVLGVAVALPLTTNATVAASAFDVRFAYEFHLARATTDEQKEYLEAYRRVDYVPYAENDLALDGIIEDGEYTVENQTRTHSYATATATLGSAMSETGNKAVTEYFAQNDTHFYIGFEMPLYSAHIPAVLEMNYRSSKGVDYNNHVSGMYSFSRLQFTVASDGTCTITAGGNGANVAVGKITDAVADVMAFTPPTEDNTTAYLEIKLNKAQFAAAFGVTDLSKFTDFGYVFRYGSTDDGKLNYLANPIPEGFYAEKTQLSAQVHSGERSKMIARNVGLIDYRYSYPETITEITSVSVTAPVMDGAITEGEYTAKNVVGDVTEYFAFDGEYVYLAFDTPALDDTKSFDISIYSGNDFRPNAASTCGRTCRFATDGTASSWIAGTKNANYPSNDASSFTFTNNHKTDYANGVIEFRIPLKEIYNSNVGTPTTARFLRAYKSLTDLNNLRYKLAATAADGTAITTAVTAGNTISNTWGIGAGTTLGRNLNFAFDFELDDIRTDLGYFGYTNRDLEELSTAVVDGVIDDNDKYSLVVDNLNGSLMNNTGYDAKEYFAYDDDNFYYAVVLPNDVSTMYYYLFASDNGNALGSWPMRIQLELKDDGAISDHDGRGVTNAYVTQNNYALTIENTKFVTKDNGDGTRTWELSLSRDELDIAMNTGKIASNFRYAWNINSTYIAYNLTGPARGSIRTYNSPNFTNSAVGINVNFGNTIVDLETADKGSVRFGSTETSGLRFKTTVSNAYLADLEAQGYTVTAGTLIAPQDYIGTGEGTKFAKLAFDTEGLVIGETCLNVVADLEQAYKNGYATTTFTGSIVNIKNQNLDRDFAARGYLALTKDDVTTYVYGDVVTHNIKDVAQRAIDSGKYSGTKLELLEKMAAGPIVEA